jgi:hypothetical protein
MDKLTGDVLPDTLSGLLEVAIKDLKAVEKDPRFEIDMGHWFLGTGSGLAKCSVCMAGAVLAKSLDWEPDLVLHGPASLDDIGLTGKLRAINSLRQGYVGAAARHLHGWGRWDEREGKLNEMNRIVWGYEDPGFYDDMAKLLKDLKEAGL